MISEIRLLFKNIRNNKFLFIIITFLSCFLILYLRRGNQLLSPEVWDEDGTENLKTFIENGWSFLLIPVSGYLITISKIITGISASISILYYPEISTYLTWTFQIMVGVAVAVSPTHLKHRYLCALAVFLVPSNPEVLGIPLYSFWLSSLLLFLVILWKSEKHLFFRYLFVIIGGLSSPIIVFVPACLLLKAFLQKNLKDRQLIPLISLSILITIVQVYFYLITSGSSSFGINAIDIYIVHNILAKFFGMYFLGFIGIDSVLLIGGLLLFLYIFYYSIKNIKNIPFLMLLLLLAGTILLAVSRHFYGFIHPVTTGPRYFFFPYILISWILLYLVDAKRPYVPVVILALSLIVSLSNFSRNHEDLEWRKNLVQCQCQNDNFDIPIHYDGNISKAWKLNLTSEMCDKLISNDMLISRVNLKCN